MPLIQASIAKGRSRAQKDALAQALTKAVVESLGAPVQSVRVILTEVEAEDWFAGGVALSERTRP